MLTAFVVSLGLVASCRALEAEESAAYDKLWGHLNDMRDMHGSLMTQVPGSLLEEQGTRGQDFRSALTKVGETDVNYNATLRGLTILEKHMIEDVKGHGGLASLQVVRAKEQFDVYSLRSRVPSTQTKKVWWCDAPTVSEGTVSFLQYQNHMALTCWNYSYFERCKVKKDALMVVGIGAYRNTGAKNEAGGDLCDPINGLISMQPPPADKLQYVIHPDDIEECIWGSVNEKTADLMASLVEHKDSTTTTTVLV